jgi:peptidoglycan/LPS O-acetylase OafA/YrhL
MTARAVPPFRRAIAGAPGPTYRPDVDGLRGVAVLAVLAFHAAPFAVTGGFVGVDVFFVISGFLITSILLKSGGGAGAILGSFYARRIKRIFPALVLVLFATSALAWFVLLADEYAQLGKHVVGGATFASNVFLRLEAGYFDVSAERKPLLHLWSLAVEEQYYLFFPLALILARRAGIATGKLVFVLAVGSFTLAATSRGTGAFYSSLARFWELMTGGLLAYRAHVGLAPFEAPPRAGRERTLLAWLGVALIGASIFLLSSTQPFPGVWTLAPTMGAASLVAAGQDAWPNRVLLSTPALTWCGRISFPLYLWHWPLLSLLRISTSAAPSTAARLVALALAFVLASLTHFAIELPLRARGRTRGVVPILCAALAAAGGFGAVALRSGGFPGRAVVASNRVAPPPPPRELGDVPDTVPGCGVPPEAHALFAYCRTDRREHPTVALLGDSKALALFGALVRASGPGERLAIVGTGGGGNVDGMEPVLSDAPVFRDRTVLATIASEVVVGDQRIRASVLVAATRLIFGIDRTDSLEDLPRTTRSAVVLDGLDRMVQKLEQGGRSVIVVVDNPTLPPPADCFSRVTSIEALNEALGLRRRRDCTIPYARQLELTKPYRDVLAALRVKHPRLVVFDTLDVLCEQRSVCSSTDAGGRLLYGYSDHVSELGAERIAAALTPILRDAVGASR